MNKYIKFTLIVLACILLCISSVTIYNSDWYINKTIQIKEDNIELTKKIKCTYTSKYENEKLKIRMEFSGINKDVFDLIYMILNENEFLIKLKFSDREGFKITEKEIPKTAFEYSVSSKGIYIVHASLPLDKHTVRDIAYMNVDYKACLAKNYDEILEDVMKQMYLQFIEE